MGRQEAAEEEIRRLFDAEYPRLVGAVSLLCGSDVVAEDAVQEAMVRLWERLERGDEIRSPAAWVTTAASNLTRSSFRRRAAERRATARLPQRPATAAPSPDRLAIRAELADLPRRQQEMVVLRYYVGLDVAEIADALGVSDGTVKTTLHRARARLAAALGDEPAVAQS